MLAARPGKTRGKSELTLSLLASLCICRHCPRYIRLSLILPASANVAPAVLASLARSLPARSTIVRVLPPHASAWRRALLGRFLTSTLKKPWLRELTLLLPVPATRRSCSPASSTISAWFMLPHTTLRSPATSFLSGDASVDLKRSGRRRYSFVAADRIGGVSRSKMRSL
jgi:hypothetical protein